LPQEGLREMLRKEQRAEMQADLERSSPSMDAFHAAGTLDGINPLWRYLEMVGVTRPMLAQEGGWSVSGCWWLCVEVRKSKRVCGGASKRVRKAEVLQPLAPGFFSGPPGGG
jgi:hypothetical protein